MQPNPLSQHLVNMQDGNQSIQSQRFQQVVPVEILANAKNGDMSAHAELYRLFSPAIHTLALGICRNKECAEDVLHNTFIQLINKVATFENRAPFGMWLRQIAVNEALMYLRRHKKHRAVMSADELKLFDEGGSTSVDEQNPLSHPNFAEHSGQQLDLEHLLSKLPDTTRAVLWLKEVEGYTHEEIGSLVGKTPSYSKSIVLRAYKFLQQRVLSAETAH